MQISAIIKARNNKLDINVSLHHTLVKYYLKTCCHAYLSCKPKKININSNTLQGIYLSNTLNCKFRCLFHFEIHLPFFWFVSLFSLLFLFCFTVFYCCRLYSLRLLSCVFCLLSLSHLSRAALTKFCTFSPINFINLR